MNFPYITNKSHPIIEIYSKWHQQKRHRSRSHRRSHTCNLEKTASLLLKVIQYVKFTSALNVSREGISSIAQAKTISSVNITSAGSATHRTNQIFFAKEVLHWIKTYQPKHRFRPKHFKWRSHGVASAHLSTVVHKGDRLDLSIPYKKNISHPKHFKWKNIITSDLHERPTIGLATSIQRKRAPNTFKISRTLYPRWLGCHIYTLPLRKENHHQLGKLCWNHETRAEETYHAIRW